MKTEIVKSVTEYYEEKLEEFGPIPRGVDWNSKSSQELRFKQLLSVVENLKESFSILDYGCGYGSLFDFLTSRASNFSYIGFDSSIMMLEEAKKLNPSRKIQWINSLSPPLNVDYVIASGVFNVKLGFNDKEWAQYILDTLTSIDKVCTKGFSFNILTKYSDAEYMKDNLYYADPCFYFDHCMNNFSRNVSVLHDYELYEFSVIVRKKGI